MVIHIVNGFPAKKPSFLQFIFKSEQLGSPIWPNRTRYVATSIPIDDQAGQAQTPTRQWAIRNPKLKYPSRLRSSATVYAPVNDASVDWARLDSNQGPRDYESPALTAELQAPIAAAN